MVKVDLRGAPIRPAGHPPAEANVIGTWARRGHPRWVEVSDLLRPKWITNVEHADAPVEVPTRQRCRVMLVVHAAVVAAIGKGRQTHDVGEDRGTIGRIVHF